MIRFDWRRVESPLLQGLVERFDGAIENSRPWKELVWRLSDLPSDPRQLEAACMEALRRFLDEIPAAVTPPTKPCVFISHQRDDGDKGERVACLVEHHGIDSWLDVHDPTLALVNQLPTSDPRRAALVAAIVEIALLSSTHVIALYTSHSAKSKWIPYELGRAKARRLASPQAAIWLEGGQVVSNCGDYVLLTVVTEDEAGVARWLAAAAGGPHAAPVGMRCATHGTEALY
jgi:TIR domain